MAERYPGKKGRTEYGGGDGSPQKGPDGSFLDLPGIAAATGARARLLRQVGMADFDPAADELIGAAATGLDVSDMSHAQQVAYETDLELSKVRAAQRAELAQKTSGYSESSAESYMGEGL